MNQLTVVQPPHMEVSEIERVALAIAKGGLFGSKDPNAVLTLCFLAHAEGQHPAVVFRDYHIIQGKPAKKAEAMLRDFITAGGKIDWHQLDDTCADATFSHPGGGSARIDWTMDRAKQAGINTPMWKKYPRQMLRSRVISEGVRTVFPGATSGLYEESEVHDIVAQEKPAMEAPEAAGGQSQRSEVSPQQPTDSEPKKRVNWGGRYPTKTALHKALIEHQTELRRLGNEGTFDDLETYLASPEYSDFIVQAGEHAPHYLEGDRPDGVPEEFVQTFDLETKARDMIAIRGNQPAYQEEAE